MRDHRERMRVRRTASGAHGDRAADTLQPSATGGAGPSSVTAPPMGAAPGLNVQRDGPALQPPSLLQQPDPAARYRLGGDYQLKLDPEFLASIRQLVDRELDPAIVVPALTQVNLATSAPNAAAPSAGTTTPSPGPATAGSGAGASPAAAPSPVTGPPAPTPAPLVPPGKGPDEPRPAEAGDLARAIMAVPAVDQALSRLRTQATEQVERDWGRLSTGERAGVVSSLAVIGLGTIGGIASDPKARAFALGQLNGRPIPVPGLKWMHVEVNTAGENLMVGLHVDVGRLLPPSLGFGPGSPDPIGAPPLPGQRSVDGAVTDVPRDPTLAADIIDASGGGSPIDASIKARLEPTLGASLSDVRLHADARADALARSVNATAFTTGQDIFFRQGAYAPSTPDGLRLLAHEATHTVQQAVGPVAGTPTPSGVALSDPGDPFEQAAVRVADQVMQRDADQPDRRGRRDDTDDSVSAPRAAGHDFGRVRVSASTRVREPASPSVGSLGAHGAAVQRQTATAEKQKKGPTGHVGGESDSVTFLPGPGTDTLAPGDAGYSRVMLAETGPAASKKAGLYADAQLRAEVPRLDTLDKQIKQRAHEKQLCLDEVSGWAGAGTNRRYRDAADWCQRHLEKLEGDRSSEEEKCASYNAWVPRANGFFSSLTRLNAMQDMLGVKDPEAMASALTKGLQDAKVVGERAQVSHAAGKAETLDVPAADETLTDLSNQTTQSAREMNTAWLGFQQNALAQRAADTNAEGTADRSRLQQINEVKAFVRNVGKTVDLTMSVVSGAPAAVATATGALQRGEASLNAYRNRRQIMAGERPTHNPTYVTVNEKGEMIVRNVQTGMDKPAGGGEATASPEMNISLPKSVSDILGTITDFVYASEVKDINMRLEAIKSRCDAIEGVSELLKIRERAQNFQDKLNAFALKCTQLQNRMAQRRTTYLQFGIQLDNFARKDAASRAAGQAPAAGDERYATIMTVVSQVREVLAIGAGARDGFQSSRSFATWAQELNERRGQVPLHVFYDDGKYFPDVVKLPDSEWKPLERIYGQVKTFDENVGVLEGIFASVEAQARALMGALNPGGGSVAY